MADFIQQAAATDQETPRTDFVTPAQKAEIGNQAGQSAAVAEQPRPQGMPVGAGMGATQENPVSAPEEEASPEEQKLYEDLFGRAMAMVNDTREKNGQPSPADAIIKLMSVKDKEAHVAIGQAAAMALIYLIDMAKRNGQEYPGPVIQEVGMDLVIELMDIADLSGAIKNMPEEDSEPFIQLAELASLELAKMFGEWLQNTGQADQQGHMQEIEQQMQREADAGELDDWNMEEMDPQIRDQVVQTAAQENGLVARPRQQQAAPQQGPQGAM